MSWGPPWVRIRPVYLDCLWYFKGIFKAFVFDPRKQEVLVYDFSNEDLTPEKYTFADQIPVHISQGRCRIDFAAIHKEPYMGDIVIRDGKLRVGGRFS